MKQLLAILLFLGLPGAGVQTITRINDYTARANKAYQQENYAEAITAYNYLLNDLEVKDDKLRLNLAHTYYKASMLAEAKEQYHLLADHKSAPIRAIVHMQLGNIAGQNKKYTQALSLFRQALIDNPENETARYNYELVKKYLALHPEKAEETKTPQQTENQPPPPAYDEQQQEQPKLNPDANGDREDEVEKPDANPEGEQQQNSGDKGQQKQNREEASGNETGNTKGQQLQSQEQNNPINQRNSSEFASPDEDALARTQADRKRVRISTEKAKMLLNAMRDAELQYLQQLPKKPKSKKEKNSPDW